LAVLSFFMAAAFLACFEAVFVAFLAVAESAFADAVAAGAPAGFTVALVVDLALCVAVAAFLVVAVSLHY